MRVPARLIKLAASQSRFLSRWRVGFLLEKPMIEFAYDCKTRNMGGGPDSNFRPDRPSGSQPDGMTKGGSERCPCFVTSVMVRTYLSTIGGLSTL
jgi:hypothetical protein